jgi:hypothetical protein
MLQNTTAPQRTGRNIIGSAAQTAAHKKSPPLTTDEVVNDGLKNSLQEKAAVGLPSASGHLAEKAMAPHGQSPSGGPKNGTLPESSRSG